MTKKQDCYQKENKTIDVMLDLETLGIGSNPVIIQIGAIVFDLLTGKTFEQFNVLINPFSCVSHKLEIDNQTLQWWVEQKVFDQVVKKAFASGEDLELVLEKFTLFIEQVKQKHKCDQIKVWGNGILSDNQWLQSAYISTDKQFPFQYNQHADIRTVVDIGKRLHNIDPKSLLEKQQQHNAIEDCKYQINYLCNIIEEIK